jgi:hypothetical protein
MKILGTDGMSREQIEKAVQDGSKFVYFQYCVSLLVITFKRSSDIYFIHPGESAVSKGLGFSAISLFFGWWGIPWGPIYTIGSLVTNFGGGKDISTQVLASMQPNAAQAMPQARAS